MTPGDDSRHAHHQVLNPTPHLIDWSATARNGQLASLGPELGHGQDQDPAEWEQ